MAEISVRIRAIDDATPAMKGMANETKSLQQGFSQLTQTLNNVAGAFGIGLNIGNAIGAVKNMITSSYELAAAMEQSQMAFSTMLGGGQQATEMLQKLRDFADKTPFEFVGLQDAAKRMMAYGFAAEEVIPMLTAVGDAAAALGGGQPMIERLTLALGQMSAKGKVSGEELRQLAEAGVPALRYLANSAGVTTGEMSKMIEKGIVPADKAIKVLLENMKSDFGGLMGKQAETASGKLSTMRDSINNLKTTIGQEFVPIVKSAAQDVTNSANAYNEYIKNIRTAREETKLLVDAHAKQIISDEEVAAAMSYTQFVGGQTVVTVKDQIKYNLLVVEAVRRVKEALEEVAKDEVRFSSIFEAQNQSLATSLKIVGDAGKDAEEAAKKLQSIMGIVGGALQFFTTETEKSDETQKKLTDKIKDLTEAHKKNYAAILGGKGTIIDNTEELERADIAAIRLRNGLSDLDAKFANTDNIKAYEDAVFDSSERIKKLTAENVNGRVSNEDLAEAIKKSDEALGKQKARLDASQMSQEDYNLELREGALDTAQSNRKIAELTEEHGKGYTAAQLAAGAQATYNKKLQELQTELTKSIEYEQGLQAATAYRLKESIVMQEIEHAAKEGFTEGEVKMIETLATALGVSDSKAITGAINVGIASTELAKLREEHAKDFETGNEEGMASFGAMAGSLMDDTVNFVKPAMEKARDAAQEAIVKLLLFKSSYDALQSKEIVLTYRERRIFEEQQFTVAEQGQVYGDQVVPEYGITPMAPAPPAGGFQGANLGFAAGGPMMGGGGPYLVGERGPELFNPASSGTIIPNHKLTSGGSLNIATVNVYGVQNTAQLFEQLSREARARGMKFSKN